MISNIKQLKKVLDWFDEENTTIHTDGAKDVVYLYFDNVESRLIFSSEEELDLHYDDLERIVLNGEEN